MKPVYINGTACISPQLTADGSAFLPEIKTYNTNKVYCVDADYSGFFDGGSLRRMSRVAKFGTGAALMALKDAGIKTPGAISIGTGLGLLENSEKFLKSIIEANESVVSPTAFIQSTHNTLGGTVALMTGCTAHNNTLSNKGFSFETALLDARMVMDEHNISNFLVGAYDELTTYSLAVMKRLNILRAEPCNNLNLLNEESDGIIAGEGAAFFVLDYNKAPNSYATLVDNHIFYKADAQSAEKKILSFLERNQTSLTDVDIVLTGLCGDKKRDEAALQLNNNLFTTQTIAAFKHLCGEYMTASSFAFWLAVRMIQTKTIPLAAIVTDRKRAPRTILIYNTYKNDHSLILLKAC